MELSELVIFDGKLLSFDDRTGVIYRIEDERVSQQECVTISDFCPYNLSNWLNFVEVRVCRQYNLPISALTVVFFLVLFLSLIV